LKWVEESDRRQYLALQALNQMADCHTRGDGVGVDDDVWGNSLASEGHVLRKASETMDFTKTSARGFQFSEPVHLRDIL
jgi:hypothetical protein